jgi:glycine oxidase
VAKSVIVVGGGIVGCLTALALVERGCDVTIVERNIIAAQTSGESSWAGAGILFPLLPWFYKDEVNALALTGASLYPALCLRLLRETGIDPEYIKSGMMIAPPFDANLALSWCKKHDIAVQQKGDDLILPDVHQVRNPRLLQALKACLIKYGVTLLEQTQLAPLDETELAEKGKITGWRTNTGAVCRADDFVVTSGAWSFDLLKNTAANLNIKPMRGQILLYQLPENSPTRVLRMIVYQDGFYLVPRNDGYLLAGSTLEDVGFDTSVTESARQAMRAKAEVMCPDLINVPIIKHWSGLRPGTPENLPTISAHPTIENLYLNTGHFRYGLTMAPASAAVVVALILGEKPQINASPYAIK